MALGMYSVHKKDGYGQEKKKSLVRRSCSLFIIRVYLGHVSSSYIVSGRTAAPSQGQPANTPPPTLHPCLYGTNHKTMQLQLLRGL